MAVTTRADLAESARYDEEIVRSFAVRWGSGLLHFVQHKPLGAAGGAIIVVLLAVAVFANFIAPYGYDSRDYNALLAGPSHAHLLGTDESGRDLLSRIVYGARVSVIVSIGTVTVATLIALLVGVTSGYFGGVVDLVVQRVVDVWQSLPGLVLLLVFAAMFGTPKTPRTILTVPVRIELIPAEIRAVQIIFLLGVVLSGGTSRLYRSATIAMRHNQFIEAGRAVGAGHVRIILKYVLPNIMPVVLVVATVQLGAAILIEAALSFLQFGIPPPIPDWGSMLSGSAAQYINRAPMLAVWPGLAIALAVFGFNMLGDGLRDVLDPRLRGRN